MPRFEVVLSEEDHSNLRATSQSIGLPGAMIVRYGMKWALRRLDVLGAGGAAALQVSIDAFFDEMRADRRMAAHVPQLTAVLAAMDAEGDGNRNAAAMHDLVGLIAGEPLPLERRIEMMDCLLQFQGQLTVRCFSDHPAPAGAAQTSEDDT